MKSHWKRGARLAAAAALISGANLGVNLSGEHSAFAQTYPSRPVKVVVPLAAGGMGDTMFRPFGAPKLSERLGVPVVVENRPGGGGIVGIEYVVRSAPDGYTLLFNSQTGLGVIPSPVKLPYDPLKDLIPIAKMNEAFSGFAVANRVPAKTLQELVALAKKNPGKLSFSSGGIGTSTHLNGELLKVRTGIDILHIPYKGGTVNAVTDAVAGRIEIIVTAPAVIRSFLQSGELRLLAVTGPARDPAYPDVPTMAEAGIPNYLVGSWFGVFAPAGTPRDILQRLARELVAVASSEDFVASSAKLGALKSIATLEEFSSQIVQDTKLWHTLVKEHNIKISE